MQKVLINDNTSKQNVFIAVNTFTPKVFINDNKTYSNTKWKVYLNATMLSF